MRALDPSLVVQAAPPASMRYYAILYTPPARRPVLEGLFLLERELAATGRETHHDVAHTRLQWWREEMARSAAGHPVHPATRALLPLQRVNPRAVQNLSALLNVVEMDLAQITFATATELDIYHAKGAALYQAMASWLTSEPNQAGSEATGQANGMGTKMGSLIRATESVRDIRAEAHAGRVHVPLDALELARIEPGELQRTPFTSKVRELLRARVQVIRERFRTELQDPLAKQPALRPLYVLAALHANTLERMDRALADGLDPRVELKPLQKLWTAWRAARRSS